MNNPKEYNGWANWETWNVVLWVSNDEGLYSIAKGYKDWDSFAEEMAELENYTTPDHVAWDLPCLDRKELNDFLTTL
jgi:hypothetical protein